LCCQAHANFISQGFEVHLYTFYSAAVLFYWFTLHLMAYSVAVREQKVVVM